METSFNYTGEDAYFSSDERAWHTKIRKLAKRYPDEVKIICQPEDNDKCIYARLPADWLKIQPKTKLDLTDEQRAVLRERMMKLKGDS